MTRYFDASALAKRYVRETGSSAVRRLLASGSAATSRLSVVEVSSAIVRRAREGAFTTDERDLMLAALQHDVPALAMVELTSEIAADARTLLLRYPLRAATRCNWQVACTCSGSWLDLSRSWPTIDAWCSRRARRDWW